MPNVEKVRMFRAKRAQLLFEVVGSISLTANLCASHIVPYEHIVRLEFLPRRSRKAA